MVQTRQMGRPQKQKLDKLSKLSNRDEEYFRSKALKQRKEAVAGKPDYRDVEDLERLFSLYNRSTGGRLRKFCDALATERALNGRLHVPNVMKSESFTFALPQDLQQFLERYYPTIFSNKEHARWFIRHFPVFQK